MNNSPSLAWWNPISARFVALLLLWGHLIYQVHYQWGGASYYNYGWIVPLLAALLLYNRLEYGRIDGSPASIGPKSSPLRAVTVLLFLLLLIPIKIVSEVNVFWRVPLFLHAGGVIAITLVWFREIFGKGNFRAVLFPVLFTLTMLPWPYRIEVVVIQGFSAQVTAFTTLILNTFGLSAQVTGSTIRLGELTVGVDDACSGIRSLQSLLMVALFLGDYFFLNTARRFALIAFGILLVFIFNTLRSTTLSLAYFLVGESFYDFWHDPVGLVTFGLSFLCLFLLTLLLRKKEALSGQRVSAAELGSRWLARKTSLRLAGTWVAVVFLTILAVEGWFRFQALSPDGRQELNWSLQPSETGFMNYQVLDIPDRVVDTLAFDYGTRVKAVLPNLVRLEAYYYGYTGEDRMSSVSSYGHSPLICMSAIGAELESVQPSIPFQQDDFSLPFQHYVFTYPQRPDRSGLHVFWTVAERNNRGFTPEELQSLDYGTQFRQAFVGRRDYSRKVILLAFSGTSNTDRIREAFHSTLNDWIQLPSSTPSSHGPPH